MSYEEALGCFRSLLIVTICMVVFGVGLMIAWGACELYAHVRYLLRKAK